MKPNPENNNTVPQVNDVCRIAKGTRVKGVWMSGSDLRIDGDFEGNIMTLGKLVIGEGAHITGKVVCASADIWGKLEGSLSVHDMTTLRTNGKFTGDLNTGRICIEVGAVFSGTCTIISDSEFDLARRNAEETFYKEVSLI
jgi:cytoskeletal protein CcmA (bactofilin family)